jgi:colanic acid/amylovoran biosynthesis glycosyltransferase
VNSPANRRGGLRVVYVVDEYPSLTQTFIADEIAERRRRGDDVAVLTMWPRGPSAIPTVQAGSDPALNAAVVLASLRTPRRVARSWSVAEASVAQERFEVPWRQLVARSRELRPVDLVHAHFGWSAAVRAEILATLLGVPWALTLHGNDVYGRDRDLVRKVRAADLPITVCRSFADHLAAVSGREVAVVPCGVAVPLPRSHSPLSVDVVTAGRLVAKKGVDVLLRAVAGLPSVTLLVVGDGPERNALVQLTSDLGIADRVRFAGPLSHEDTCAAIAAARVCCVPSRVAVDGDRDSMPVVAKEAMAAGTPVVVTAVEGLPELVDSSCGWVVPPERPILLATALRAALEEAGDAALRASRARERVQAKYTIEFTVGRLRALQMDLVARSSRSVRFGT